ncbi:hypothetical protein GCM10011607_28330 [Shewanella inventionis]|uniref:Uncharacterized protein n=1 Tax=Shewanella inventionis TaxID=1738770 RepID=A0ABQ1JFJ5_9GAMM|nr:hypothetical protein [Shewanella inventionis]GGB65957.1 hypothetical protein GCM10011607_28330 [Shewanella inventionis]
MGIIKKVGLWVIRPSIFNMTPGASNPFYDAKNAIKKASYAQQISVADMDETIVGRKHKIMAKELMKVPENERLDSAHLQLSLAFLYFVIYLISVSLFFFAKSAVFERISTPFVQLINSEFGFVYYVVLVFITIAMISQVISALWRSTILRNPPQSVPFPVFFIKPSLWLASLRWR